jgi:hypothetical protein
MLTKEEVKAIQEAMEIRNKKVEAYRESIDKLKRLNQRDFALLEKYWEEKYSKYKRGK